MSFSYTKLTTLRPQKDKYLSTFLIAIAVATAFFLPYIILGNGYFIFYGDFNVQQIPFYQKCHEAIRQGNIAWSWTTDLGANFIGSYSFYLLGSPFFWLTMPFPNWMVPYLMGPLLILKFGCAAFTAYCYIRRFTKTSDAARLGALLYAFSGFSVYNIFFNHFHEAIICFPLLLLSLELLLTENKRFIFALTVCLCAIVNYFFFFGMVVFVVIYYIVRVLSGAIKFRISRLLVIVFESCLGVAISAGLLLPSILAIIDNNRVSSILLGWNAIMYGKEQIYGNIIECFFFPPDIPARPVYFPGADVKWSSLGGWLPLFSMVGVFAWFQNRKSNWLKRIIGICIFMAMIPILNSSFYAFNTSYYARWFYMPILMMCLATVMLTEDNSVNWKSAFKWVTGITIGITLTIGLFPQKNTDGKLVFGLYTQSEDYTYAVRFWLSCFIALLGLVLLWIVLNQLKEKRKTFYTTATCFVCILSIVYANVFVACGRSHSYEIKDVMIDQLIEGKVNLNDDSSFRVDVYDGVDNTSMYLGLPGINAFHSIVPTSIFDFYKYIGVERSVGSRPKTEDYAIRPLLSVKYLLNRKNGKSFLDDNNKTLMPDYNYKKTSGGYYIYENENYIPYGFSYNYYMSYKLCDSYSEKDRASLMLKAILLTDKQIEKYGYMFKNLSDCNYYNDPDSTSLSISEEAMKHDCKQLANTSATYFKADNKGFTAKVTRDSENLVFLSVPFDKGWSATVNGNTAKIEKVNKGFMAVKVDKGESTIRFTYKTPGLALGLKITLSACGLFLVYIFSFLIYTKKHPGKQEYPEGEELLLQWRRAEIDELHESISQNEGKTIKPDILDFDINSSPIKPNKNFEDGFKIDPDLLDNDEDK